LTSSSPSKGEDSFCKTAMSRREDIVSCIDVTIMDRLETLENRRETTVKNPKCAMLGAPLSLSGLKAAASRGRLR
jgi:hypothetical protein